MEISAAQLALEEELFPIAHIRRQMDWPISGDPSADAEDILRIQDMRNQSISVLTTILGYPLAKQEITLEGGNRRDNYYGIYWEKDYWGFPIYYFGDRYFERNSGIGKNPVCFKWPNIIRFLDVRYWSNVEDFNAEPDMILAAANVGRFTTYKSYQNEVWPPDAGWPDAMRSGYRIHFESGITATSTLLGAIRNLLILHMRQLADGDTKSNMAYNLTLRRVKKTIGRMKKARRVG